MGPELGVSSRQRPSSWSGRRRLWLIGIVLAALWAAHGLGARPGQLVPTGNGWSLLEDFVLAAFQPALSYENAVPDGTVALPWKVLDALRRTLIFAAAGMSLALLIGLPLGALSSSAWWSTSESSRSARWRRSSLYFALRTLIALMRSVHELLWALLFLAALGLNSFSAVWAIAIPYGGTLAKVFSEMLDEAPRDSAELLHGSGASRLQVFLFGLLPRAMPDMAAYAFYRLECAVRSSAVMGFFGFPTIGYFLKIAFVNQHYHEVWSYLWALIAVVLVLEFVSSRLRERVVLR